MSFTNFDPNVWGEEWRWPTVERIVNNFPSQEVKSETEVVKTETEVKMEEYIETKILMQDNFDTVYPVKKAQTQRNNPDQWRAPGFNTWTGNRLVWCSGSRTSTLSYSHVVNSRPAPQSSPALPPTTNVYVNHSGVSSHERKPPEIEQFSSNLPDQHPPAGSSSVSPPQALPPDSLFRPFNVEQLEMQRLAGNHNRNRRNQNHRECAFCRNNGEPAQIYRDHKLREGGVVTCPYLREIVCELCGATGDQAHTRTYCPMNNQQRLSIPMLLKKTKHTSAGKLRKMGGR